MRPSGVKRSFVLVPVLFAALLVLPTAPAWACSCAQRTLAQYAEAADVVLRGTLEDVGAPSGSSIPGGTSDTVTYRIAVSKVFRGAAPTTTFVSSAASGASCGLEGLEPGREYVVFAQVRGDGLAAGLCGGTAAATSGLLADVEQVVGPGQPPVPPGLVDESAPLPGADSGTAQTAWTLPLVGGAALALVLAGLLLGVVRRGRRRG